MLRYLGFYLWGGKDRQGFRRACGVNPAPGQPVTAVRRDGIVICRWSNSLDWKRRGEKTDLIKWKYLDDELQHEFLDRLAQPRRRCIDDSAVAVHRSSR